MAFDIDDNKGPLIDNPIRTMEQVSTLSSSWVSELEQQAPINRDRGGQMKRAACR